MAWHDMTYLNHSDRHTDGGILRFIQFPGHDETNKLLLTQNGNAMQCNEQHKLHLEEEMFWNFWLRHSRSSRQTTINFG
jgi:hypothetical protein